MGTRNVETGFIIYDPAVTAFGNDPLQNLLIAEGDDAAGWQSGTGLQRRERRGREQIQERFHSLLLGGGSARR